MNTLNNPRVPRDITETHDINDNEWIVALGDRASDGRHSLLLTPVGCVWDVNEDGHAVVVETMPPPGR